MADENTQNEFSYIGKTPLLRGLKNPSGQFFLFSQYAEDLTKFLGNPNSDMPIPCSFYCLKVEKPNTDTHVNETVTDEDPDAPIPAPGENQVQVRFYGNDGFVNHIYYINVDKNSTINAIYALESWGLDGETFAEWNTESDGSGNIYLGGEIISVSTNNINLYAQWISEEAKNSYFPVYYHYSDSIGTEYVYHGSEMAVSYTIRPITDFVDALHSSNFDTWNTQDDGTGSDYAQNAEITLGSELDIYAIWTETEIEEEHEEDESVVSDKWTPEQIATLFIDPADEDETLLEQFNAILCKELKYKGNINIFGRDKVDGINYNEIYCHIDNDAKRQKFQLDLSDYRDWKYGKNYVIGYGPNPNDYQFTNYSDLIGEIFQNEYENGNTFFKLNNDLFDNVEQWKEEYSLGRLLYILYKNEMIHFVLSDDANVEHLYDDEPNIDDYNGETSENSSSVSPTESINVQPRSLRATNTTEYAGVLSSKALFDSWYEGDSENPARGEYRFFRTNDMIITDMPEKMKFDFNCIIVCYTHKNMTTGESDGTEIPMGIYFTGYDINEDDFSNVFTKYVKNMEIYNQGTSYTLRICARTIASQATEQGAERIVEILSTSNTGEWVNEYEMLMSKFDETNNTLEQALSKYAQMNDSIETNLQLFRNNRTNVPYVAKVNGIKYWFVNGTNTWTKVLEPTDYADWTTNPIESAFTKVDINTSAGAHSAFVPTSLQCYANTRATVDVYPENGYEITDISLQMGEISISYSVKTLEYNYDIYSDTEYPISIKRNGIPDTDTYNYEFTILETTYGAVISSTAAEVQNNE